MISAKDISYITEKITRRFEIELPINIENFKIENNQLHVTFHESEPIKTFELTKGVIIEFDSESRIIGLNVSPIEEYLPKSNDETTEN